METFLLWCLRGQGAPMAVTLKATSRANAVSAAQAQGWRVLEVASSSRPARTAPTNEVGRAMRRSVGRPRIASDLFADQLSTLLKAGIGPVEALRGLVKQARGASAPLLQDVLLKLEQGQTLASALESTGSFDDLLVALVRAAEETSDLPQALERYLQHALQSKSVKQRIVTTSIYPAVLLVVGGLVMAFLLIWVVPRFSAVFASMQGELPWAATLMLRWGELVKAHGTALLLAIGAVAGGTVAAAASPSVRGRVFARLLRQRHVGYYVQLIYLSRLYRTAGMLLDGGIAFPRSLQMASRLLPASLHHAAEQALEAIRSGVSPSAALEAAGLSSPVAQQLLLVGERSGELGAMMTKVAAFHEGETARAIERFMRALEPTIMALMGVGIGFVVIVMYLPVFELASVIR
ncbi:type II secretion system F family protein [Aquabacterium sp. A7-Y]|uniref:type II secretion system F family protein n=1 Tax=Aquabacterium sp. A7-Y TaxID=1349605 RepID=UPI00223DC581|nr:type II secretion system F family protein [Aquabacterium sp. A7-Y]MCW7542131.1 type II secretion system F family protein [Aquabacterium sp. A7-Y]